MRSDRSRLVSIKGANSATCLFRSVLVSCAVSVMAVRNCSISSANAARVLSYSARVSACCPFFGKVFRDGANRSCNWVSTLTKSGRGWMVSPSLILKHAWASSKMRCR